MGSKLNMEYYSNKVERTTFNGEGWDYLRICVLSFLLSVFTLGIGRPWALCMRERWRVENTFIEGKVLGFEGTGSKLFWRYVGWSLLTLITLGIYGFWKHVKIREWMVENTYFV